MKFPKIGILVLFAMLFLNTQCDDDVDFQPTDCDVFAVIDDGQYQNADSAFYEIVSAEVVGDCLNTEISSSGCSGETWVLELFSSSGVMESFPVQRNIRLVLLNEEACLAVFTKEMSFDLTHLRVEDANEIRFNLFNYDEQISYTY